MAEKAEKSGATMAGGSSVTFKVSVLRSGKTGRVLFVEAGKDFVDTLLGFLLLPIAAIMHMLSNAGKIHVTAPICPMVLISPLLSDGQNFLLRSRTWSGAKYGCGFV